MTVLDMAKLANDIGIYTFRFKNMDNGQKFGGAFDKSRIMDSMLSTLDVQRFELEEIYLTSDWYGKVRIGTCLYMYV